MPGSKQDHTGAYGDNSGHGAAQEVAVVKRWKQRYRQCVLYVNCADAASCLDLILHGHKPVVSGGSR